MMVRAPLTPEQLEAGRRLGEALRAARGSRSLNEVAVRSGISPETLRKIETGRLPSPAFGVVAALCSTLGLSLDELAAHVQGEPARAATAALSGPRRAESAGQG